MAITIIQERKKQRYLILALALIIFAILAVVWLGFFRRKSTISIPAAIPTLIYTVPKVEIDWQILEDLRDLPAPQPFIEINAFEGEFGRKNPFIPY